MEIISNKERNELSKPSVDKIWLNRSKKSFVNLPDSRMNVYDYLYETNRGHLDDVALYYDALIDYPCREVTYRQLFNMIDDCANSFINMGVKSGEIVTISLPSLVESIVMFYALNKIGATPNYIHPLASEDEVNFYLEEAKSRIFVSYMGNYDNYKFVVENRNIEHVIVVSPEDMVLNSTKLKVLLDELKDPRKLYDKLMDKPTLSDRYITYKNFIKEGKSNNNVIVPINRSADSAASLTHTSGTTGRSKGVLSSSYGYNEMTRQIAEETPILERGDKELLVLPPYPIYVLCNNIHMCLSRGISVIVVPKVDYKNMHKYFLKHSITAIQGIPSIISAMINDSGFDRENIDLSNIKFIVSGGGNLSKEDLKQVNSFLRKHNCKYNITVGYGMSEMGSCSTCTFNEREEEGSVGRPLNDTNIMIVDKNTLEELDYNEPGEILINGPCRMIGYYKNEDATNKIFVRKTDESGNEHIWVRTGDMGFITPSGNLHYIGRIKRITMIVDMDTNAVSKISNDYVEDLIIGKYPSGDVLDCVVVGVANKDTLNKLKAYVVVKDSPYTEIVSEIDSKCKESLRNIALPTEYIILSDKVLTGAGKKDFKLLEKYENNQSTQEETEKVNTLIKKRIKIR